MKIFNKIIEILKSKWLRDTEKTAILVAGIIVIFLGINVLIQKIDPKDIDLTSEQLYSLTDESKEKIASLPKEDKIQIYMFDYEENSAIVDIAKQYTKANENVTIELVNSKERPDLVSKYNVEDGYGTVIILSGEKNKILNSSDFYNYDYNTNNYIDVTEQRFTNGIISVSSIRKNNTSICA